MEISKSLQEEIVAVQNKLQNAILEHQIYVGKSKDDPNNSDILGQIQQIQLYIVSLGRCQKQIVQRLRKEVEAFKADNANGSKISIPSLLGLNNNNHITNNNETKREAAVENGFETKSSKEDYEEVVRNGDVHHSPAQENDCAKLCPSSVETIFNEDDVMETSMDENSNEKQEETQQEEQDDAESAEQQNFMYTLGLITKSKCIELQNKRVERKRRSTANPQFVYSMLEQPSKRKRHTYLQSGNAPHTRQTTARMNGPSPPPLSKPQPTKSTSTSPPAQTVTKSLIPIQRSITRPNILRNTDSKVFVNKSKAEDNQTRSSVPGAKSIQSISNKTVHIPGLPSSLTIERIENDSVVCICCRNPGILTVCKNCSSNYHISCHIRSPAPARICPKCVLTMDEDEDVKDEVAEIESQVEEENKLPRCKKDEKFEEKQRERYELRERNSDLRLQVYELEKRSQLLGQSFQLQQRLHQELLGKQEKTQKSIKRLVDFIKLIQVRKNTSSPLPSASCPPQPSSSRSPQTTPPPQSPTNQKVASSSSMPSNDSKTPYPAPLTISTSSTHDRTSPTFKQEIKCLAPTSCPVAPSSKKNINHISLSKQSSSRLGSAISLVTVKSTTKTALPPLAQVTTFNSSQAKASPGATTSARSKSVKESHRYTVSLYQNCQILLPRTSITWTEQPSMAESPGPSSHVANSVSISQPDSPQKAYCLSAATPKTTATSKCSNDQSQPDQQKMQEQQRTSTVVANTEQEPELSCTQYSQAATSPTPSPVVYASHEASAQTTETIRFSDSSSAARCASSNPANNQTTTSQQQQSSSSGALSRDSSST